MAHPLGDIRCFFLERAPKAHRSFRRFVSHSEHTPPCSAKQSYHYASILIEEIDWPHDHGKGVIPDEALRQDPRWPTHCACGYKFSEDAQWQEKFDLLYSSAAKPDLMTLSSAPPGAMWYADWYPYRGPDNHCLIVKTPAGDWVVDANSSNGPGWTRTGTPPIITATPSIGMRYTDGQKGFQFHAFLRNGVLQRCPDSKV